MPAPAAEQQQHESLKRPAEESPVPDEEAPAPKVARVEEAAEEKQEKEEKMEVEAPAAAADPAGEEKVEEALPPAAAPAAGAPSAPAAAPASRALRVDNFVGAVSDDAARALLSQHGGGPLSLFWMEPQLRTHCFVVFEDASSAAACERALAGMEWPAGACNALRPIAMDVTEVEEAVRVATAAVAQEGAAAPAAPAAAMEAPAGDFPKTSVDAPLQWTPAEGTEGGANAAAAPPAEAGGAPVPPQQGVNV